MESVWQPTEAQKFLEKLAHNRAMEFLEGPTLAELRYDPELYRRFEGWYGSIYEAEGIDLFERVYEASERIKHPAKTKPPAKRERKKKVQVPRGIISVLLPDILRVVFDFLPEKTEQYTLCLEPTPPEFICGFYGSYPQPCSDYPMVLSV